MRTTIILLLGLIISACQGGGSQTPGTPAKNEVNLEPSVFDFVEEIHNFGDLQAGEKVIYSFVFTNTGGSEIRIDKAEAECTCLEISYDQENIKPGGKGKLKVVYDTSGQFGPQFQMFRVIANNGSMIKDLAVIAEVKNENIIYQ